MWRAAILTGTLFGLKISTVSGCALRLLTALIFIDKSPWHR
jgi:hypothetical protein